MTVQYEECHTSNNLIQIKRVDFFPPKSNHPTSTLQASTHTLKHIPQTHTPKHTQVGAFLSLTFRSRPFENLSGSQRYHFFPLLFINFYQICHIFLGGATFCWNQGSTIRSIMYLKVLTWQSKEMFSTLNCFKLQNDFEKLIFI